jgi:hypothetical protein
VLPKATAPSSIVPRCPTKNTVCIGSKKEKTEVKLTGTASLPSSLSSRQKPVASPQDSVIEEKFEISCKKKNPTCLEPLALASSKQSGSKVFLLLHHVLSVPGGDYFVVLQNQSLRLLPQKVRVFAAEVSKSGGLAVDGAAKLQFLDDHTRSQVKVLLNDLQQLGVALLTSSVGVNEQGHGVSKTNGVGDLHENTVGETGSDEGLGDPPASISGRTIDFGWVLSRESTSSVGSPTTISVDDDLTASRSSVTLRSTNDETSRRVQVVDDIIVEVLGRDGRKNDLRESEQFEK